MTIAFANATIYAILQKLQMLQRTLSPTLHLNFPDPILTQVLTTWH